jgi:hypothetical protein
LGTCDLHHLHSNVCHSTHEWVNTGKVGSANSCRQRVALLFFSLYLFSFIHSTKVCWKPVAC